MPFQAPVWPPSWPEIEAAVIQAVRSGQWGSYQSDVVSSLSEQLATRFQAGHVRLCCSGSAAIEIALRAAGVGPGDEVIVAAFDYPGNFRTIEILGARPVLVDVASGSPGLDPENLHAASGDRVRAVIASHLFGVASQIDRIRSECDASGWVLIEDACQVPGMMIDGRPAGSFGHFATLSFGGSKPITAGNGGALLTSDKRLAARLGGLLDRPSDVMPLSPLQAAVLQPQLERLAELNLLRQQTVAFLESQVLPMLSDWQWLSRLDSRVTPSHYKVAWAARSESHRRRIVEAAVDLGLPIGQSFHSLAKSNERRCRKPVSLEHSTRLGDTLFVLDHRALLIERDRHRDLGEYLRQLHDMTSSV